MDPFTVAVSGFAVISLADQLFENVREIKSFISYISESQRTLQGLVDKLELLELVFKNIRVLIEKQQQANGGEETMISASVLQAMAICKNNLQLLEGVINSTRSACKGNSKARELLGAFKLALKRERLEDFERQLQNVLTILDLTITLNLTDLQAESSTKLQNEVRTTISNEFSVLRTDLVELSKIRSQMEEGDEIITRTRSRYKLKKTSNQISRRQTRTISTYPTIFGTFYYRHQSTFFKIAREQEQNQTTMKALVQDESSVGFIPTFHTFCVELYRRNMCGSISRGIKTYQSVDPEHPVFDMCSKGDIIGLQACFSGDISPFIICGRSGQSLLHTAVDYGQLEVCSLLLRLGTWKDNLLDNNGHDPLFSLRDRHPAVWNDPDGILHLFASRQIDIVEASPSLLFWRALHTSELRDVINEWVTEENINVLEYSPLVAALRSTLTSRKVNPGPEDASRSMLVLRRLIGMGGDIHRFFPELGTSLLDDIIELTTCPFEFRFLMEIWINALEASGIDIQSYVEAEMAFRPLPHQRSLPRIYERQRILFFSPTSYIPIWWEWQIPNHSPAYEVLEEFKNFGPPAQARIISELGKLGEVDNSPFEYSSWLISLLQLEWHLLIDFPTSDIDEAAVEARMRRFEWKVGKKLRKKKGRKEEGPRSMPGAWID